MIEIDSQLFHRAREKSGVSESRRMIVSRTRAGLAAARERGVKLGAPRKMNHDQIRAAKIMMKRGIKAEAIAQDFGVGRELHYLEI